MQKGPTRSLPALGAVYLWKRVKLRAPTREIPHSNTYKYTSFFAAPSKFTLNIADLSKTNLLSELMQIHPLRARDTAYFCRQKQMQIAAKNTPSDKQNIFNSRQKCLRLEAKTSKE